MQVRIEATLHGFPADSFKESWCKDAVAQMLEEITGYAYITKRWRRGTKLTILCDLDGGVEDYREICNEVEANAPEFLIEFSAA